MKINKVFNNKYIKIDLSKNAKPPYYLQNILIFLTPSIFYQKKLNRLLNHENSNYITTRVNYYNKINHDFTLRNSKTIKDFKKEKKKTYFFDLYRYLTYFNEKYKVSYLFGDTTKIEDEPTIQKSRPIQDNNSNAILMKLNKIRHFIFVKDKIAFEDKKTS